jgi:hypothetical protein
MVIQSCDPVSNWDLVANLARDNRILTSSHY